MTAPSPVILFLSSTSLHFPLDLQALLANEGHNARRIDSIDSFLSSPERNNPYLAVLEVGSTDELERAALAYEWCEKIQPLAPCRVLILLASKNIQLGDKATRFGTAEIAHLPLPLKNLLFKIDLQKRLLTSDQTSAAKTKKPKTGFSASFVERPPKNKRILLARGPGPKSGQWREVGESPQGKVRWRWVNAAAASPEEKEAEQLGVSWVAESDTVPVYEEANEAWAIEDPEADLVGFRKDKPVFSARSILPGATRKQDNSETAVKAETTAAETEETIRKEDPSSTGNALTVLDQDLLATSEADQKLSRDTKAPDTSNYRAESEAQKKSGRIRFEAEAKPKGDPETKVARKTPARPSSTQESYQLNPPAWSVRENATAPFAKPLHDKTSSSPNATSTSNREPKQPEPVVSAKPPTDKSDSIPEFRSADEPSDQTGYSVPVPSEGKVEAPKASSPKSDSLHASPPESFPRKEAEYDPANLDATAQPTTAPKPARENEAQLSFASAKETRPAQSEQDPLVRGQLPIEKSTLSSSAGAPPAQPGESSTQEGDRYGERTKNVVVTSHSTSPGSEEKRSLSETSEPLPTAERKNRSGYSESPGVEKIRIEGEEESNPESKITIEGSTERIGEKVRVRSHTENESNNSRPNPEPQGESYLKYRHFVTMTLDELNDRDSSWHPVDRYRIYLSAQHRYYGVKNPHHLMPIWVYEGELAPEFLDDKKAWKFYDRYPDYYSRLETLPKPVLEHVFKAAGMVLPEFSKPAAPPAATTTVTSQTSANQNEKAPSPEEGIWGGVLGFFKKLFGG